ncbi:ST57 domain protein [Escherichia coli DEC10A]|nr:ST57 domain protein [Escherichia coli DEC10A]
MLFTYSPDNPEGAAHQLQLFGGILTQIAQLASTFRAA